jgi:hypothetical protein
MKVKIENGEIVIKAPVGALRPSASGKNLVVATSGGNKPTTATVDGKPVIVGFNAYIKK